MNTSLTPQSDFIETELKKFETEYEITESGLTTLSNSFKDLKVNGVNDREGLKAVESARKTLKKKRVEIQNVAKNLRDSATKFQKAVIARENELVAIIEPTEDILSEIEDSIYEEKERLRLEEERKEDDRIQTMINQFAAVGHAVDYSTIKGYTEDQFHEALAEAIMVHNRQVEEEKIAAENKRKEEERFLNERKEQEERQRKFEEEQAAFRAEQKRIEDFNAKVAADLKAAQDKLDADKKAIEDAKEAERQEKIRLADLEKAKKEAADKARIEAEAKAKREAEEKIETDRLAKEQEEEKMLAGDDSGRFGRLRAMMDSSFLSDDVIIWTHFKSKKGKSASAKVHALLKEAKQICIDNIK